MNEGLGPVLRFGANDPAVIERLRWLNGEFADVLRATLAALPDGALALQPLMARALQVRKTPSWPRSWANFSRS